MGKNVVVLGTQWGDEGGLYVATVSP